MAKPSDHISLVTDPAQLFCRNCGVTSTPLWRRSINDDILCNACGLYMKLHNMARPKLRKAQQKDLQPSIEHCVNSSPIPGNNKSSVFCSNCYTNNTPLWRRDDQSNVLCNACGLYLKLHQERRPLSLKTDVIKKRQRYDTPKKSKKAKTGEEASEENSVENSPDQSSSGTSLQTTFMDTSSTEPSPCHSPSTQPIGLTSATYSPLQNQQQQHSLNMQIKQEPVLMNGNTGLTNLNGVDFQTAIQSANLYATNGWPTTTTAANANLLQPSTASTSGRNTPSKQQHTGVS
ncbi:hypothetical protein BDF19DRAFT_384682 [Syncephalis fuscata]|nr:hypothetical protein BDF19DRAFT_384682 [Syncephalis fuscata]